MKFGGKVKRHRLSLLWLAMVVFLIPTARVGAQTKTNFASSVTSESMTAVWVARDRGLFRKHGLDMQFILMPRNPLAVAALIAGEIDAAIIGPGNLVNACISGADMVCIGDLYRNVCVYVTW